MKLYKELTKEEAIAILNYITHLKSASIYEVPVDALNKLSSIAKQS